MTAGHGLRLRPPLPEDEAAFADGHRVMATEGFTFGLGYRPGRRWATYLKELEDHRHGRNLPIGHVPGTFLVATVRGQAVRGQAVPGQAVPGQALRGQAVPGQGVPGQAVPGQALRGQAVPGQAVPGQGVPQEIVGRTSVRFMLNAFLAERGGHIGYAVLPQHRRRGYATEILRQSLIIARAAGVDRVLVTCDESNAGSRAVIEACGGVLDSAVTEDGKPPVLRFWID